MIRPASLGNFPFFDSHYKIVTFLCTYRERIESMMVRARSPSPEPEIIHDGSNSMSIRGVNFSLRANRGVNFSERVCYGCRGIEHYLHWYKQIVFRFILENLSNILASNGTLVCLVTCGHVFCERCTENSCLKPKCPKCGTVRNLLLKPMNKVNNLLFRRSLRSLS